MRGVPIVSQESVHVQRKFSYRKLITFSVVSLHGIFLILLICNPSLPSSAKDKKPLIVKTIAQKTKEIRPPSVKKAQAAAPSQSKKETSPPTSLAPPKTSPPAQVQSRAKPTEPKPINGKKEPAIADKIVAPKQATPKPPAPRASISDSLLKELETSLEKIEKPSAPAKAPSKLPAFSLEIDTPSSALFSEDAPLYAERVVSHLQNHLTLPDFGEVKIQLDLREDGSVDKIIVLSSKSKANKLYLEENLPQLRFPPPEKIQANGKCRFVFTFANEV